MAYAQNPSDPSELPEQPPWNISRPRLRVLIVDDQTDAADSLACLVNMDGHAVAVAYDGPTAVEMGQRFCPDVVLLDIGLPLLDGWEVATRLLGAKVESKIAKKPLVIAVTGRGSDRDRQRSAEAGIFVHVVKPANPEVLLAFLRRFRSVVN